MILPIADRVVINVAWDKSVSLVHAKQEREIHTVMEEKQRRTLILPIVDSADLPVLQMYPAVVAVA